ncbi:MAG TPA: Rab family GTPase [Thermoplasmata archaeon]|nr:Rab family GTPase [Thermoplasmata archaeon]
MVDRQRMKVKVCLVGEGAVGKTCLIRRFIHDQFDDRYISTLGAKVSKKEVVVQDPKGNGEIAIDMTIWDIMGEKGFRELLKEAYFHGAQGVLAVCDITRKDTLHELHDWIAAVHRVTGAIPVQFLANKSDMKDKATVTEDDMQKVAESHKSLHLFTSAKTGENVEVGFLKLAEMIASRTA